MKQVFWSELTKKDYWNNIEYLENEWTISGVYNFVYRVDELINLLTKSNVTFKASLYKDTFQIPVIKQITLFYKTNNNTLTLLRFWNNYNDLSKLKI
ncbi:MAG: type II toxin-antitoxin system RelE/ParE family toxin [Sphingobacteriales bacterium]|nr:MAG: type II toxin-antitoxin system RelE/ParE family toxin [Sphingobacteriales bacterium]